MSDFSDSSDVEVDTLDESFTRATEHIQRTHTAHAPNDMLELYALYKQATTGRCNTAKPGIFNMQGRAKWCAWNDLADMAVAKAKELYIAKVRLLDPSWCCSSNNDADQHKPVSSWVVHSIEMPPTDVEQKAEHDKTAFDYVKEGNLERLQQTLSTMELQSLDEHGMGLIHWAADRNHVEILAFLIDSGADVNLRDADQKQTALHYAASCGHTGCIRVLLNADADRYIMDVDGQTCVDVADHGDVRALLEM